MLVCLKVPVFLGVEAGQYATLVYKKNISKCGEVKLEALESKLSLDRKYQAVLE